MNPLVTILSLLLSLFRQAPVPAAGVDEVVRKTAAYERGFELAVMDIVAVEHYDQKATRNIPTPSELASMAVPRSSVSEHQVNSDIVMFQDVGISAFPYGVFATKMALEPKSPIMPIKKRLPL